MALSITSPAQGALFPFGEAVELAGTCSADVTRVDVTSDGPFVLPTVTLADGRWTVAHRFHVSGRRDILATALGAAGQALGSEQIEIEVAPPDFGRLVKIPTKINQGLKAAQQSTMLSIFGKPGELSAECTPVTNERLKSLLVLRHVGPFAVTGVAPAVDVLSRVFAAVKQREPELFGQLGTAGMLCCRRVRRRPGLPPSPNFSNHSWGTAVDIKVKGKLDPVGDGLTQLGLLLLQPFFNKEGFFWGAGFRGETEDSMHFEASDGLVREWKANGLV
jgi:hypothetical protein